MKITAEKHILCYLWFVGHETASYRDVADRFGITLSALHNIITRVTTFILSLARDIIKYPTLAEKEETVAFYFKRKGFPGIIGNVIYLSSYLYFSLKFYSHIDISVLGAIDSSHIRIDKPIEDPESYVNRK